MDLLKAELERRKKEASAHKADGKKFRTRGEIEAERRKREREEEEERQRNEQERKRRKLEDRNERVRTESEKEEDAVRYFANLPKDEVVRRLRRLGQVVTYFGETDEGRALRLKEIEEQRGEVTEGQRNEFLLNLMAEQDAQDADEAAGQQKKKKPVITDENVITMDKIHEKYAVTPSEFTRFLFIRLLNEWEAELEGQPDEHKRSAQGREERVRFKLLRSDMEPLLKGLKKNTLQPDIQDLLYEIATDMTKREYVAAADAYFRLSIGNSPWPMGVTMVGIHERSAREKIETGKVAHILNDETSRKYIQGVKRLMSFCQRKYPHDPSRMVVS